MCFSSPAIALSTRRRSSDRTLRLRLRLAPAARVATLDLSVPGERAAVDLVRRMSTGRWPSWRVLGMRRTGQVLLVAVQWLRTRQQPFSLVEVSLVEASLRWRNHSSRQALLVALRREQPSCCLDNVEGSGDPVQRAARTTSTT